MCKFVYLREKRAHEKRGKLRLLLTCVIVNLLSLNAYSASGDEYIVDPTVQIGPLGIHVKFSSDPDGKVNRLKVEKVFEGSPAEGLLQTGDIIVKAEGLELEEKLDVLGSRMYIQGPAGHLAEIIDKVEGQDGKLNLQLADRNVVVPLPVKGTYNSTYPYNCDKSFEIFTKGCDWLVENQQSHGAWTGNGFKSSGGSLWSNSVAGLALLSHPDKNRYKDAIRKAIDSIIANESKATSSQPYCRSYTALFLSEYYIQYKDSRVVPILNRMNDKFWKGQNPYGGWSHGDNAGLYGGGGLGFGTANVVLALGAMKKTGVVKFDEFRYRHMIDHLQAITRKGQTQYVGNFITPNTAPSEKYTDSGNNRVTKISYGGEGSIRTAATLLGLTNMDDFNRELPAMTAYLAEPGSWVRYLYPHATKSAAYLWCLTGLAPYDPQGFRSSMDYFKRYLIMGRRFDGRYALGSTDENVETGMPLFGNALPHACMTLIHGIAYGKLSFHGQREVQVPQTAVRKAILDDWKNYMLDPATFAKPEKYVYQVDPPLVPHKVNYHLSFDYEGTYQEYLDGKNKTNKEIIGTIVRFTNFWVDVKDADGKIYNCNWFRGAAPVGYYNGDEPEYAEFKGIEQLIPQSKVSLGDGLSENEAIVYFYLREGNKVKINYESGYSGSRIPIKKIEVLTPGEGLPETFEPEFTGSLKQTVNLFENSSVELNISHLASDKDNDTLYFEKYSGADWIQVLDSGSVSINPPSGSKGNHEAIIKVFDGLDGYDLLKIQIEVKSETPLIHWSFSEHLDDTDSGSIKPVLSGAVYSDAGRNGAVYFDGIDDSLKIDTAIDNLSEYSISFWVKADGVNQNANAGIFSNGEFEIAVDSISKNIVLKNGFDTEISELNSSWNHILIISSSQGMECYVNGAPSQIPGGSSLTSTVNFGSDLSGKNFFKGWIDEVIILKRALSFTEAREFTAFSRVNNTPNADADSYSILEEEELTADVLKNDSDSDNDQLSIVNVSEAQNGFVFVLDNKLVYRPSTNWWGTEKLSYTVSDGIDSVECSVEIVVKPVNTAPVAVNDSVSLKEDSQITVKVLSNDSDQDEHDVLEIQEYSEPKNGTVVLNADKSFTYKPNKDFYGEDSFTYTIFDKLETASATVNISVWNKGDAPVAVNDNYEIKEDTQSTFDVLENDYDVDLTQTLKFVSFTQGSLGKVSLVNNKLVYNPNINVSGTDTFTYTIKDGDYWTGNATGTVTVDIQAVNDAPLAQDDELSLTLNTPGEINVLENDFDVEGDNFTFKSHSQALFGTVTGSNGNLSYEPHEGFSGSDSFTYTVEDSHGFQSTATVHVEITLNNVIDEYFEVINTKNGAVKAEKEMALSETHLIQMPEGKVSVIDSTNSAQLASRSVPVNQGNSQNKISGNALQIVAPGDYTYDGETFNGALTSKLANTGAVFNLGNDSNINVSSLYFNYQKISSKYYRLLVRYSQDNGRNWKILDYNKDGQGNLNDNIVHNTGNSSESVKAYSLSNLSLTGVDKLQITVWSQTGNYPMAILVDNLKIGLKGNYRANNDSVSTLEDTPVNISVKENDETSSPDDYTIASTSLGNNGTVTVNGNDILYTPNLNWSGTDSFTYTVKGNGEVSTAKVTINVTAVNDAPTAVNDEVELNEDSSVTVNVLENDFDIDTDKSRLQLISVNPPAHGKASINNGLISYTPDPDFNGTDSFTYVISDRYKTAVGTVNVTVKAIADAAKPVNDLIVTAVNTPASLDLLNNDRNPDNIYMEIISFSQPSSGSVTMKGSVATYNPVFGFSGHDSFTYEVKANGITSTATVKVDVREDYFFDEEYEGLDTSNGYLKVNNETVLKILRGQLEANELGSVKIVNSQESSQLASRDIPVNKSTNPAIIMGNALEIVSPTSYTEEGEAFNSYIPTSRIINSGAVINFGKDANFSIDELSFNYQKISSKYYRLLVRYSTDNKETWHNLDRNGDGLEDNNDVLILNVGNSSERVKTFKRSNLGLTGVDAIQIMVWSSTKNYPMAVLIDNLSISGTAPDGFNQPPTAEDDTAEVQMNSPGIINPLENDSDPEGDTLKITNISDPSFGYAEVIDNKISYTPVNDYEGSDTFSYTVTDSSGNTAVAKVSIEVVDQTETVDPDLEFYWSLDSENKATDLTGKGHNGVLFGSPEFNSAEDSMKFDGVNDKVVYNYSPDQTIDKFTVSLWVKTEKLNQRTYTGIFNNNSSKKDLQIDMDRRGYYRYHGSVTKRIGKASNNWSHISVVCDGQKTVLYFNGEKVSEISVADNHFGQVALGTNRKSRRYFKGEIDELIILKRPLDSNEVKELFSLGR